MNKQHLGLLVRTAFTPCILEKIIKDQSANNNSVFHREGAKAEQLRAWPLESRWPEFRS